MAILGASYTMVKLGLRDLPVFGSLMLRMLLATIVLVAYAGWRKLPLIYRGTGGVVHRRPDGGVRLEPGPALPRTHDDDGRARRHPLQRPAVLPAASPTALRAVRTADRPALGRDRHRVHRRRAGADRARDG